MLHIFGKQGENVSYDAIKRLPEYFQAQENPKLIGTKGFNAKFIDANKIAGAIKTSLTRAPFKVDAGSLPFKNGIGLGVITLNKATKSNTGKIKLNDDDLNKIGGKAFKLQMNL